MTSPSVTALAKVPPESRQASLAVSLVSATSLVKYTTDLGQKELLISSAKKEISIGFCVFIFQILLSLIERFNSLFINHSDKKL